MLGFGGDSMATLTQMAPLVLIFVVFYFLLIRPQQQKAKQHKTMLEALRRGDRVVTGGGIIGTVAKVGTNDEVAIDIAENVRVRVLRSTITTVLARTEPVSPKEAAAAARSANANADGDAEERVPAVASPPRPADNLVSVARRFLGGK